MFFSTIHPIVIEHAPDSLLYIDSPSSPPNGRVITPRPFLVSAALHPLLLVSTYYPLPLPVTVTNMDRTRNARAATVNEGDFKNPTFRRQEPGRGLRFLPDQAEQF